MIVIKIEITIVVIIHVVEATIEMIGGEEVEEMIVIIDPLQGIKETMVVVVVDVV